ncbi:alpha/beta hydrolase [Rugamonas rivuli]|uniref:Alpha/beta hydrolase fold domain-containing protein n=1 Tax=Rugamonas rivuli TaxID=2743358 RepID=A0A843SFS1_9BURK|nr:alpha/beta hydrolase [Rugamonas rivuli]MQA20980.1 alpha/beta hydrolase fold domain-containing protein [Rugamonas rivuli]
MKYIFLALTIFVSANVSADAWQPSSGHAQLPLWPGAIPNPQPAAGPEDDTTLREDAPVAGKPWLQVSNVTHPTMTIYPPKGKNTGAAVVVFPGGGYRVLAIDLEGTEVCDWLTDIGVTCVLLKYRVPGSGPHWDPVRNKRVIPKVHTALQDAQRAVSLLRHHAADWKIDPNKIGVLGFSAGGHLVAAISTYTKRIYPAVDEADRASYRPDFAVALYPGHMSVNYQDDLSRINPGIVVTKQTPPTFLVHAQDDPVDPVEFSLLYYAALRKANVPVEMHLFAGGKHAFGLRPTGLPITKWPQLVETWLTTIGVVVEHPEEFHTKGSQ